MASRTLPDGFDDRNRIGNGGELVGIAVRRQATKNEETAVCDNDIPLLKEAIAHNYFRSDVLGFSSVRGLPFDTTRLCDGRKRGGDHGDQAYWEQPNHSA